MTTMNPQFLQMLQQAAAQNRGSSSQSLGRMTGGIQQGAQARAGQGVQTAMFIQKLKQAQAQQAQQAQMQQQQLMAQALQTMAQQKAREQEAEKDRELRRGEGGLDRASRERVAKTRAGDPGTITASELDNIDDAAKRMKDLRDQIDTLMLSPEGTEAQFKAEPGKWRDLQAIAHLQGLIDDIYSSTSALQLSPAARDAFDKTTLPFRTSPEVLEQDKNELNWQADQEDAAGARAAQEAEIEKDKWSYLGAVWGDPDQGYFDPTPERQDNYRPFRPGSQQAPFYLGPRESSPRGIAPNIPGIPVETPTTGQLPERSGGASRMPAPSSQPTATPMNLWEWMKGPGGRYKGPPLFNPLYPPKEQAIPVGTPTMPTSQPTTNPTTLPGVRDMLNPPAASQFPGRAMPLNPIQRMALEQREREAAIRQMLIERGMATQQ